MKPYIPTQPARAIPQMVSRRFTVSTTVNAAQNTAIGALPYIQCKWLGNTAIGFDALGGNTTGILQNTAIGAFALRKNTRGSAT